MQETGSKGDSALTVDDLRKLDAYWRAANYLSVGMLYLRENPLLKDPMEPEHIKRRLLGHWGSDPGQSLVWAHLNRLIKKYDLNMIYISGPGHGAPAVLANASALAMLMPPHACCRAEPLAAVAPGPDRLPPWPVGEIPRHRAAQPAPHRTGRALAGGQRPARSAQGVAARRSARDARRNLQLVHRGLRHRRPEGREGAAQRAEQLALDKR